MAVSSTATRIVRGSLVALLAFHGCVAPEDEPEASAGSAAIREIEWPAAGGAFAPHLAADGDGLLLTWLEVFEADDETDGHRLRYARYEGGGWSAVSTVAEGSDFFANWADVPSVARSGDGSLVAHWLAKSGGETYAYSIELARSTDEGATWQRLGRLNDDNALDQEHGFVTFVPEGDALRAFWLDGRQMAADGPMSVRSALVTDGVGPSEEVVDRVCECCPTGGAATSEGAVIVYRGRSEAEVRDFYAVRREAGGWGDPVGVAEDGWQIPGCPVNGPGVEANGDALAVAWFTAANEAPRVRAAFSSDAARNFGPAITVDDGRPLGRVDLALLGPEEAIVSWLAVPEDDRAQVNLRRVGADGTTGEPLTLAETGSGRSSGYPELERLGDSLYVAWVETAGDSPSKVWLAEVPIGLVPGP